MLDAEYEVGFPVAAGQLEAGGVTFACAPVKLGGKSFGSAIFGSKRLPARTELIESPLALAAATVGCWMRGLPAAVWPLESVWLLADGESEVEDDGLREEVLDFDLSRLDWNALDLSEESSSAAEAIARLDRSKLEAESLPSGESAAGVRASASCKQARAAAVTDKRLIIVMRSPPVKSPLFHERSQSLTVDRENADRALQLW